MNPEFLSHSASQAHRTCCCDVVCLIRTRARPYVFCWDHDAIKQGAHGLALRAFQTKRACQRGRLPLVAAADAQGRSGYMRRTRCVDLGARFEIVDVRHVIPSE